MFAVTSAPARLLRLPSLPSPLTATAATIRPLRLETGGGSGLVSRPVIAVPTSVGYGASMHGLSALLTMINSCANGIAVVNIDNGYGAGYLATQINRLAVGDNPEM